MTLPSAALKQFYRFSIIGTLGFVVDASLLLFLTQISQFGPFLGRTFSFLCAATTTWILNRTYTFSNAAATNTSIEWAYYVLANGIGGAINFTVYTVCILNFPNTIDYLILGVAAGSISGLTFNFSASKFLVFHS
jgi:putative flippase GtrA